jgi:hypothetical protein
MTASGHLPKVTETSDRGAEATTSSTVRRRRSLDRTRRQEEVAMNSG